MSTVLNFGADIQGYNAYAPYSSTDKYSASLTNGNADSITVPSNHKQWIAVFSYQPGTSVWVDFSGATAAIPAGSTFASTTSELNPGVRQVNAGDEISVITANSTADVSISLYAIGNN